ncbi:MAG: hypothetical protein Q7J35_10230 [Candidatus Methanoperedens sp.]|nr:hypothetical protein [Candidatus Methanoperedens sp.]
MKIIDCEKADVESVGTLILISITIIGIGLITLVGVPSIFKMQEMANVRNAEQAFTVLDSHTSRVSLGESQVQKTDINLGGGTLSVVPNSSEKSYVLIELKNGTSTVYPPIVLDMGKIVYRLGDRELGYEGGGVWSKYISGSIMISPPEVHYNGMTLTLPVVNISGKSAYGGNGKASMSVARNGDIKIIYPTRDLTNPISENVSQVAITIYSSYYDAWADFFTGITFARVERHALEKKVTINLETPPLFTNFSYGALASDQIILSNNANIESYNSSEGGLVSSSGNGSIRANNLVRFTNAATGLKVNGSVISGVTIDGASGCTTNKCKILKDAYARSYTGTVNVVGTKNTVTNDLTVTVMDATTKVLDKINSIKSNNNNTAPPCISGNVIDFSSVDTCTISNGNYYLTGFTLSTNNKNLVFDTTSDDINIAVDMPAGDITWRKANISVTGPHNVKIWLNGGIDAGSGGSNAQINLDGNPNYTSSRFQVVSSSYRDIKFQQGGTQFIGFVYAPGAKIYVEQGAEIYGALVGKQFSVTNSQKIYFDEALQNLPMDFGKGVTIMYLHITQNDIGVSIN